MLLFFVGTLLRIAVIFVTSSSVMAIGPDKVMPKVIHRSRSMSGAVLSLAFGSFVGDSHKHISRTTLLSFEATTAVAVFRWVFARWVYALLRSQKHARHDVAVSMYNGNFDQRRLLSQLDSTPVKGGVLGGGGGAF